jgi:hypothetical protein
MVKLCYLRRIHDKQELLPRWKEYCDFNEDFVERSNHHGLLIYLVIIQIYRPSAETSAVK